MTLLDHYLQEEKSYWSIQALLRKAICKGKWVLLYGSRVIAVSETRDEIVNYFRDFSERLDPRHHLPGAICVQVGNENKFYRIPVEEEEEDKKEKPTYFEKKIPLV
ncbi:MAG: hypothetical protein JSV04_09340 [Candidatus Heimdallarchaeota archaeon]|nr:MAG: hypothetical protein JSV04_09340 [Candidatus Heimdallarchaeota archaeon]